MVVVDCLFAIFWLSAFASQAAYNSADSCGGQCNVSKAIVGMAFFEMYDIIPPAPPRPLLLEGCEPYANPPATTVCSGPARPL